jgi:hypothetical protein
MHGANTSLSEVLITNIERDGFWLLVENGEYFVWPNLDIDIELEALKHPDRFPLKFRR